MSKKRKYNTDYLKFGFTFVNKNNEDLPQCVICHKILSNDAMKPSKLERHLVANHPQFKNKTNHFFASKLNTLKNMKLDLSGQLNLEREKTMEVSYKISMLIAKSKKPHTIGERLIKPCLAAVGEMFDMAIKEKILKIPLSDNSVKRRIDDMADDIKKQLFQKIENSLFIALQCDETTDVSHSSQLLFYCRFIEENKINEEFLFVKSLKTTSKGSDIYKVLSDFLSENNISWSKVIGICTDGAASMMGSHSGFLKMAKENNKNMIGSHCVIHRHALASKTLPVELKNALQTAIDIVNFIKSSALRTRLFEALCIDLNTEQTKLLFHTEVRWLSKGNMLKRLYNLKTEVEIFLLEKNEILFKKFTEKYFIFYFAYICDFFEALNNLNLKLQGRQVTILTAYDAINAFMCKILLWKDRLETPIPKYSSFPLLNDIIDSSDNQMFNLKSIIIKHLDTLHKQFSKYFPEFSTASWQTNLICNPFNMAVVDIPDNIQEELIELLNNSCAKSDFESMTVEDFWLKYYKVYPLLGNEALKLLIQFASTYLCEVSFSALQCIKTKYRSRLDVENELRCALSEITPNVKDIIKSKQF
ncbi:Zinc finger BED domain-containing protein 5 [Lucilia cuprina]|nr:Zinc finger BED domain-containing protein 5 [Lucilia cuprina]